MIDYKLHYEDHKKPQKRKPVVSENMIETIQAILAILFIVLVLLASYLWLIEIAINAGISLGDKL